MLTPSILNHEIHARIRFFKTGLQTTRNDLKRCRDLEEDPASTLARVEILEAALRRIERQLLTHAERLHAISGSVMGLTRRIPHRATDVLAEMRAVMDLLSHAASAASVDLTLVEPGYPLPEITTDPALLMHIMVNLVKNAIEVLEPVAIKSVDHFKRVWIEIRWDPSGNEQRPLCVDVCDNGAGVPGELGSRIFEAGITTKTGGHGLGLAICLMIAGYLGGTLEIASERDPTCLRLRLPQCAAKMADLEEELKSASEIV
jgi:signal transduction histidine kinase